MLSSMKGMMLSTFVNSRISRFERSSNIPRTCSFCAATHTRIHTFFSPIANHGDLEKLLEMPERPLQFKADEVFFVSLVGLTSALDAKHHSSVIFWTFISPITITHHDLAPRNILANVTTFLLANFGLSQSKDPVERSSTSFKHNRGFYSAPECQDLEGKLQAGHINYGSDIWSFGCTILEASVYIKRENVDQRASKNLVYMKLLNLAFSDSKMDPIVPLPQYSPG